MKLITSILNKFYNILLVLIILGLLFGVAVIAETNSWYYLLLYIPISVFIYESEGGIFRKKKRTKFHNKS